MNDIQQSRRIPEIELLKAIAIIGMIFVHVLEVSMEAFENAWELPGSIPYTLIEFLGGIPAAGAFTFAMGWGAAFNDKVTVKSYLRRAKQLGILLFYVNFIYAMLPGILYPAHYGAVTDYPWAVLGFNIYSLATLSMLFFALMKKLQDKPRARLGICLSIVAAILTASFFAKPEAMAESDNQWLATLIGIFVRQNDFSWFPLVPWGLFPIMGYGAGILYRKWNDRKKFALTALAAGVLTVPSMVYINHVFGIPQGAANPGWVDVAVDYYSLTTTNIICAAGILCLELALMFGILTLTKGKLHWVLAHMSHHVMNMFCGQWLFIIPFCIILSHVTDVWFNVLYGYLVLAVTFILAELGYRHRKA